MTMRRVLLATCLLALPAYNAAQAAQYEYEIRGLGFSLGAFSVNIEDDLASYAVQSHGKLSGLAALFASGTGTISTAGSFAYGVPTPHIAKAQVNWDGKPRLTVVKFADGAVKNVTTTPPYKIKPGTRAPLDDAMLKDVQDPLSAVIRPIENGVVDCTVRLKIFDGRERYDLQFSPTENKWTCHAQAINIGGYELKNEGEQPRPVRLTFMPVFGGKYAFPKKLERTMLIGHFTVRLIEK